jgi:hypothetical protein
MADPVQTEQAAGSTLQTVGFLPTFLYYFTGATLIAAVSSAQAFNLGLTTGAPFRFGIIPGLLAGLAGAYFNRTVSLAIPCGTAKPNAITNPKSFTAQLNQALTDLGYAEKSQLEGGYQVYQRSALRHWLSGSILVQVAEGTATIFGRASNIRRLQKKLQ